MKPWKEQARKKVPFITFARGFAELDGARPSSHPVMTDRQKSSLSRSVAERQSLYPLRLHHNEAGKSTSPIKKTRKYNSEHSSKGRRRFERSAILTHASPSVSYPIPGGTAPAERREIQPSGNEVTVLHRGNDASEFQAMDTAFESGGWEDDRRMAVANEGVRNLSLDESDEMYAEAVEADVVGFIPVCGNSMFVVEGWSRVLGRGTVRISFYWLME